ncbi:hypothetical protein NEHOM01_0082 [Nematocida homosporus]|uniref:uncharacterized protein n=1 Tax=Nematocida homosporus TaxID=1912981 RepID=UPI00222052A1|nr:uncharacterized protein NEHOM01_0082 [Nematocida homosporus]KAI5184337.1 hypothetical protein NEHOM01_0082 [Nematocida homosporus]
MLNSALTIEAIAQLTQYIQGNHTKPSDMSDLQWTRLQEKAGNFLVHNNRLYYAGSEEHDNLLEAIGNDDSAKLESIAKPVHIENGHMGPERLYQKLRCNYLGFTRKAIREVVSNCSTCTANNPMQHVECNYPMMHLQIDCIDMRHLAHSNDGYGWILIVLDVCSKFIMAEPMIRKTGKTVAKKLSHLFAITTRPWIVQCDNGEEFVNDDVIALMKRLGIDYRHSQSHLRIMGQVKRAIQSLVRGLFGSATCKDPERWIDDLDIALDFHNRDHHRAINQVPVDVCYGWPASSRRPIIFEDCQEVYEQEVTRMFQCEPENVTAINPIPKCTPSVEDPKIMLIPVKITPVDQRIDANHRRKYLKAMDRNRNNRIRKARAPQDTSS